MKPKRLTIIFFSIMMLAATPRAMSHFNNYAGVLNKKVEAEWLNILLGVATRNEIEEPAVSPKTEQPPVICTEGTSNYVEPSPNNARTDSKATSSSLVSKKRSFQYTLTNTLAASTDTSNEWAPGGINSDRNAFEKVIHNSMLPGAPVAINSGRRSKIEYLLRLSQSASVGKLKSARALVRELTSLNAKKSSPAMIVPVEYVKASDQPANVESDVAERDTNQSRVSSEGSMQ